MSLDLLTTPRRMTDLDAVNAALQAYGEHTVGRIDQTTNSTKAANALGATLMAVQGEGWNFCSEEDFELEPDADGFIIPADNILSWTTSGKDVYRKVQMRDGKLYDLDNKTFVFTEPLVVLASRGLVLSDLQAIPARYIAVKAAMLFITGEKPTDPALQSLEVLRRDAHRDLMEFDKAAGGLVANSPHFQRIRGR